VEYQKGDMSRRSKKKAMQTLGVIGDNVGIDQQAQEEYAKLFSATHIAALAALFGWRSLEEQSVAMVDVALAS
jgi:hypothetical protein